MSEHVTTPVHVVQPDQGESFWQPVPANGYAEVRVSHRKDPAIRSFATGIQVIAPGSYIREHVHPAQEELLFFFEGEGEAVIDGESHPLRAGTAAAGGRAGAGAVRAAGGCRADRGGDGVPEDRIRGVAGP
jgi:hypothetical protein